MVCHYQHNGITHAIYFQSENELQRKIREIERVVPRKERIQKEIDIIETNLGLIFKANRNDEQEYIQRIG